MLVEVYGRDIAGTTMFIYYDNGDGTFTLLGSASNTTAANDAQDGSTTGLASYAALVFLPDGGPWPMLLFIIKQERFKFSAARRKTGSLPSRR
jgi:hypothetical protein